MNVAPSGSEISSRCRHTRAAHRPRPAGAAGHQARHDQRLGQVPAGHGRDHGLEPQVELYARPRCHEHRQRQCDVPDGDQGPPLGRLEVRPGSADERRAQQLHSQDQDRVAGRGFARIRHLRDGHQHQGHRSAERQPEGPDVADDLALALGGAGDLPSGHGRHAQVGEQRGQRDHGHGQGHRAEALHAEVPRRQRRCADAREHGHGATDDQAGRGDRNLPGEVGRRPLGQGSALNPFGGPRR